MQVKGSGSSFLITNPSIAAGSYTEVTPPGKFNVALIKCRTAVNLLFKRLTGDSTYLTIPSGQALELDIAGDEKNTFFLQSASGTVVAEILWAI